MEPTALPEPVLQNPRSISIYLIVVVALAALGVLTVLGGVVLAWADKSLPESVIVPIRDGGARLDDDNLQSLCRACHDKKSAQDVARRAVGRG